MQILSKSEKILKKYDYYGTGFLIKMLDVPMSNVMGELVPDIDYQEIDNTIYEALITKPARLTGNELHFIRLHSKLTLQKFADKFDVTHAAVKKWESNEDKFTKMKWPTEMAIRLFMVQELKTKPTKFVEYYRRLSTPPQGRSKAFSVNAETLEVV